MIDTRDRAVQIKEATKCYRSLVYFVQSYCQIYDSVQRGWIPFELWDKQRWVLGELPAHKEVVILKARQLGLTWLCLSYALWLMLFRPEQNILLFSRRHTESKVLLQDRLKVMYNRLPLMFRNQIYTQKDSTTEWRLSNGSGVGAFPTNAGDSYTATLAIIDEADLVPDLDELMTKVQPTIDAGGQIILLSRSNKDAQNSKFKRVYLSAIAGSTSWFPVFLAWHTHPRRDEAWYEQQKQNALAEDGHLDSVYEQYPATDNEALDPAEGNKRILASWCRRVFIETFGEQHAWGLAGFTLYKKRVPQGDYVIGVDVAEGNPHSDNSALSVINSLTGQQVACYAGKVELDIYADIVAKIARYYNDAGVLVERNNHGHTIIALLKQAGTTLLKGHDGKVGWVTSQKNKAWMYDQVVLEIKGQQVEIYDRATYNELVDIESSTLSAPVGLMDDRAVAYCLGVIAMILRPAGGGESGIVEPEDAIEQSSMDDVW